MSKTEFHHGKLRPVDKSENETFEEFAKRISLNAGLDRKELGYSSYVELILTELGYVYSGYNNTLYEIYDHKEMDNDYFHLGKIGNESFEFIGSFYNGGTCLTEMLEEGIEKELKRNERV